MNFKTAMREANAAYVEDLNEEALDLYNTAIMLDGSNSDAYSKRAQCHLRLRKYKGKVKSNMRMTYALKQRQLLMPIQLFK